MIRETTGHWFIFFLLLLLGSVLYANSLDVPFYLDDFRNILENRHLHFTEFSASGLYDVLLNSTITTRPVSNLSFSLNYYLHGENVVGYHAVNILIHILTGFFLYRFAFATLSTPALKLQYQEKLLISSLTALIWLAHPLHTQSVTYIVQRMNSMAVMFYMLSIWLYVEIRLRGRVRENPGLFAAAVLSGLLAIGAKEIAVTLPFFIVLYEWYFFQDLNRRWLLRRIWLPALFIIFVLLFYFFYIGNPLAIFDGYDKRPFTPHQRVLTEFRVVLLYLGLLFFPFPGRLNLDHNIPVSLSLFEPVTTSASLAVILLLLAGSYIIAGKQRLLSFAILWYFGNLVIESSILSLEIAFEHRTYLPSILVIFALTTYAWQLIRPRWVAGSLAAIIICLFSVWTITRNNVWRDPVHFWTDSAAKAPGIARPLINLSVAHRESGEFDQAIAAARQAIDTDPRFVNGFVALAAAHFEKGELDQAIVNYQIALRKMPDYAKIYNNLAQVYLRKGMIDMAAWALRENLRLAPADYEALVNLASLKAFQGKYSEAIADFLKALETGKKNPDVLFNLAVAYAQAGDPARAMETYRRVLEIDPYDREALRNLDQLGSE